MREAGINIAGGQPKHTDAFVAQPFDYVITVCDDADRNCPFFHGKVGQRLHIGFADPAGATGSDEEIVEVFCNTRDAIPTRFRKLYEEEIQPKLE